MEELLDDKQVGQEEQQVPTIIYWLAASYVGFWIAMVLTIFTFFDRLFVSLFAVFCLAISFILGIAAVLYLRRDWEARLRRYSYFMLGSAVFLLLSLLTSFLGRSSFIARTFDLLILCTLVGIGLFLVEYYKNRQKSAAWWPWIEQSMLWYFLLHFEKFLALIAEVPLYGSMSLIVPQIILLWVGAGSLLRRIWTTCNVIERQVSLLLYGSLGLILSIMELNIVNSVLVELLLLLAIVLLIIAVGKAQAVMLNSEKHE